MKHPPNTDTTVPHSGPVLLIGTSGWSYNEWKGVFYPRSLKSADMLRYYADIFFTAEINSTFYRIPDKDSVERWVRLTPDDFVFSAKIPREISHNMLDPDKVSELFPRFLSSMTPLIKAGKIAVFLLQLPPAFGNKISHADRLINFFEFWNEKVYPILTDYVPYKEGRKFVPLIAVEFRNLFWADRKWGRLLGRLGAVYCIVVEPLFPDYLWLTHPRVVYVRFHGFGNRIWFDYNFDKSFLQKWANRLNNIAEGVGAESFVEGKSKIIPNMILVYFNNHFSGNAVKNALMLGRLLQNISITKYRRCIRTLPADFSQTTLDDFI